MSAVADANAMARSRAPKIGLILIVIAVIGALAALDMFLEEAEQAELAGDRKSVV